MSNKEVINLIYSSLNNEDISGLRDVFSNDVELITLYKPVDPIVGPDNIFKCADGNTYDC